MLSEKVVAVMLVVAIVLSAISIAITLNANNISSIGNSSLKKTSSNSGNAQLIVENSAIATASGGNAGG